MTDPNALTAALRRCPVIAILRGVTPGEVEVVGEALDECGIAVAEVPLNSPEPFESIRLLARRLGGRMLIGAGTVLRTEEVARLADIGCRLVVSPNVNAEVIRATRQEGMISLPGYYTATEALVALDAGASALKLFPVTSEETLTLLKAHRAILPGDSQVLAVGGVNAGNISAWMQHADGVGVGSALYRPGDSAAQVRERAHSLVAALHKG